MQALTAIAATVYAVTLWMFAPESVWRREVETAKQKRLNRLNPTPESIPQPQFEPIPEQIQTPEQIAQPSEPTPETITETEKLLPDTDTDTATDTTPEPQQPDYSSLPITKLRELAKQRKLNWRPLINGKRKPLNKPQLIQLLTA